MSPVANTFFGRFDDVRYSTDRVSLQQVALHEVWDLYKAWDLYELWGLYEVYLLQGAPLL